LQEGLALTVAWYRAWRAGEDLRQVSLDQVASFEPHEGTSARV
jgi:hypothetical protein